MKIPCRKAAILGISGLALLAGCSTPKAATGAAFSLNTPVDTIAANQGGKAVLDRDVPGLMASGSYMLFEDMSLTQIASMSGGQLPKSKLDLVQTDLAQLPASGTAPSQ